jgi:hypothetical protein
VLLISYENRLILKNKGFPGRKESLRSIAARFDGVLTRLASIDMILLANLQKY